MRERPISLLDVVALLKDAPGSGLARGQVGSVVEELNEADVMVEFADADGHTFAIVVFPRSTLLRLEYEPQAAE